MIDRMVTCTTKDVSECKAESLPGNSLCLVHCCDDERLAYLESLKPQDRIDKQLRHLQISATLLTDIIPYLGGLDYLTFSYCIFSGDADFANIQFSGIVSFESVRFQGQAIFGRDRDKPKRFPDSGIESLPEGQGASFAQTTQFSLTRFESHANFDHTHFFGNVAFTGVDFEDGVSFDNAVFEGSAVFSTHYDDSSPRESKATYTTLSRVTFSATQFSRQALFYGVRFRGLISFALARFQGPVEFSGCVHEPSPSKNHGSPGRPHAMVFGKAEFSNDLEIGIQDECIIDLSNVRFTHALRISVQNPVAMANVFVESPVSISGSGRSSNSVPLLSLAGATLQAPLIIEENISLADCSLDKATGLNLLRVTATNPEWILFRHRRVIVDEYMLREKHLRAGRAESQRANAALWRRYKAILPPPTTKTTEGLEVVYRRMRADEEESHGPTTKRLEGVYRQMRAALEESRAAPDAADFYYGEMEMRRLSFPHRRFERMLLSLYKLTSGYGLRAYRALLSYLVILFSFAALFRYRTSWFVLNENVAAGGTGTSPGVLSFDHYWDVVAILSRSAVNFAAATGGGLTAWGTLSILLLRLAAPTFLALAILAIRARVQR